MNRTSRPFLSAGVLAVLLTLAAAPALALEPCVVPDNGAGTIGFPPPGCAYLTTGGDKMMVAGLPATSGLEVTPVFFNFACLPPLEELKTTATDCSNPGGSLGGDAQLFDLDVRLDVVGTGDLAGFRRVVVVRQTAETHTAPRQAAAPFDADFFRLPGDPAGGYCLVGDPDFDFLCLRAGSNLVGPSAGATDPTPLPSGDFQVDSFFDVSYEVRFTGAPGGRLAGLGNEETEPLPAGVVRVEAFADPFPPSIFSDGFESGDVASWSLARP